MTKNSLLGLKVVVTRPREQAAQLAQRFIAAGGVPILFPLLEISPVADDAFLQQQLASLAHVNLIIFISPNAVQYGMAAIRKAGGLPAEINVATVGQGSAKVLRAEGVARVIVPEERFDSEGLLARAELQNVSGWNVLILRGDGGRELLGDTLKARGAKVEYVTCYQRSKPTQNVADLLQAKPQVITVTSSEALSYLWQMMEESARAVLCELPLFVPHPRIAELAQQQGWRNVHQTAAGDDGLLSALVAWSAEKENINERKDYTH